MGGGPGCPATVLAGKHCRGRDAQRGAALRAKTAALNSRERGACVVPAPAHREIRLPVCSPAWWTGGRVDGGGGVRSLGGRRQRALQRQRKQRCHVCAFRPLMEGGKQSSVGSVGLP